MRSLLFLSLFTTLTPQCISAFASKDTQRVLQGHHHGVQIVHRFPEPTWIENLAIRHSGKILVTLLNKPEVYMLPAPGTASYVSAPNLLHSFPFATGLLGIAEVDEDVFAVVAGNFSLTTLKTVPGSYSIWTIAFNSSDDSSIEREPKILKVVDMPEACFLNGLTALPGQKDSVLVADSGLGAVWKIDTRSGHYENIIQIPEFAPVEGFPIQLGINGLRVVDETLYFTNTNQKTLSRVPIMPAGHVLTNATVETLLSGSAVDDFDIGRDGTVWQTTNPENTILSIHDGTVETALGSISELTVAGATSGRFGRGKQANILFISTNGGLAQPVNGTKMEGGKIVAFDTRILQTARGL